MTDPTMTDPVILPTSPMRSVPPSPNRMNTSPRGSSSPNSGIPETPAVQPPLTDLLDVPSTDGESHEGDDDTAPSSRADERSQDDNSATTGLFDVNKNKRVGTIIDVTQDTKVYIIKGNAPDEDDGLYEGQVKPLIYGYLNKLGRNGKWQRRFFETDGECLTYFKSDKRTTILASLDLSKVGAIGMSPDDPIGSTFIIQVVGRPYSLRAENKATCKDWVITLNRIKEARLQLGGVKLLHPEFPNPTVNALEKGDGAGEITPRVVLTTNRQRTRAIDDENVDSWEALLRHEKDQNAALESETQVDYRSQNEILARWQKRRSMLYSFSRAAMRWARNIRQQACASGAHHQVRLDAHLHPPGHDDACSSATSASDMNDKTDPKMDLEPSWPSPPPASKSCGHEIT